MLEVVTHRRNAAMSTKGSLLDGFYCGVIRRVCKTFGLYVLPAERDRSSRKGSATSYGLFGVVCLRWRCWLPPATSRTFTFGKYCICLLYAYVAKQFNVRKYRNEADLLLRTWSTFL